MKKILVTGATGFIGMYVVAELLRRGHDVVASSTNVANAKKASWYDQVEFVPFDFNRYVPSCNYVDYFKNPEQIIHLAWEGLPDYRNNDHLNIYLPRHRLFLENLLKHGLKDITVTGTCLEYGYREGKLDETMECKPELPYAMAKNELRIQLQESVDRYKACFKWIRLFYMYGKGQNPKSLFSQLDLAISEGHEQFNMSPGDQIRDFLPVEKVASNIVTIALQDSVTGIINCCSGKPVAVKDFVEAYLHERQASIKLNTGYYGYPDYEPMAFWGDNKKLTSILSL